MRILTVHAKYAQPGGEDEVYRAERDLLRANGHCVTEYVQDNSNIRIQQAVSLGLRTVWSRRDYHRIRASIRQSGTEIVAVHNFFPLISPAVYYAARAEGVPVVQTLHNYRLICPAATLLRDGKICDDCVGRTFPFPAIQHACYRDSRVLTSAIAVMTSAHKLAGTWDRMVTRYIALTEPMKARFVSGGFAADRIDVKPNFTPDTDPGPGDGNFYVFAGRLSREKGVHVLLEAWKLAGLDCELHILGGGPEEMNLRAFAAGMPNVRFMGQQSRECVQEQMGRAIAVLAPSIWPEAFGLTIIEAFAKGTPVLATDIESIASLVRPGRGGFLFPRGDAKELARLLGETNRLREMRTAAREEYESRFTAAQNYRLLEGIYQKAIESKRMANAGAWGS